jgi:hypothetical protein
MSTHPFLWAAGVLFGMLLGRAIHWWFDRREKK